MPNGKRWFSLMHLGIAAHEMTDTTKIASKTSDWEERSTFVSEAISAWCESIALKPSVWVYKNLAVLNQRKGNCNESEACFDKIYKIGFLDYSLESEFIKLLNSLEKYESLSEELKAVVRLMILAAKSAVNLGKLDFLENFFTLEHSSIAEGKSSLTR